VGYWRVIILKWKSKKFIVEKSAKIWGIYTCSASSKNKLLLKGIFLNGAVSRTKVANRGCVIHSVVALMRMTRPMLESWCEYVRVREDE